MREVFPNIDFFSSHTVVAAWFGPKGSIFSWINKSVLTNIATPEWNEYEEKVNLQKWGWPEGWGGNTVRSQKKKLWFYYEMIPDQERGFPPMPYILNVRLF